MKTLNGTRFMALAACLALALGAASPAAAGSDEDKIHGFFCTYDWTGFAPPLANGSTTYTSSEETTKTCVTKRDQVELRCKTLIPIPGWNIGEVVREKDFVCQINVGTCGIKAEDGGTIAIAERSRLKIDEFGNAALACNYPLP